MNWPVPKFFECLRGYTRSTFAADFIAGLTVGLVALPLAMAFGIASGVTPQAGIYTAILGGFLVAILGGSKIQVSGPTGAFVVIVSGIIAKFGISGLHIVTMMAGVILVFLGLTGLGTAIKFIPRPIVIGFTNGIAVLIASTQVKDFFGLTMTSVPSEFLLKLKAYATDFHTLSWQALAMASFSLAIILFVPKLNRRIPGAIVALVAGTVAMALWKLPIETIGSKFGGIPAGLPAFEIPVFRPDLILPLLPSALTVAILSALESLLSAVVSDGMIGDRHNSGAELVGQGVANLFVPLVGGIPVTGAIARTATNFKAGAKTPVAAIVHAFVLLSVILVFAPLAKFVPLATLSAVMLVVAYNMGEWREIPAILKLSASEISVWLITFVLTVVADLTLAVEIGMALAALLYIYRISQTTTVGLVTPDYIDRGRQHILQDKPLPEYVSILRIHGPFLFGTTDKLEEETEDISKFAEIVVLRLRNMTAIDATGLHAIERLSARLKTSGRTVLLCGARNQPREFIRSSELMDRIGEENVLEHVEAALIRARELHEQHAGFGG